MQAGYLKLWQQLQKNPDCFADKPKAYIVQAVIFGSKSQRFSHQRHYHKLVYNADADQQRSVSLLTTGQVDIWIDLEQAIGQVACQVENSPAALLGLYCLLTQAGMRDVADTFGVGYSTLHKKKQQVKAALAAALEGYGPQLQKGKAVTLFTAAPLKPSEGLVTSRLLESIHEPGEGVIYQAPAPPVARPAAAVNGHGTLEPQDRSDTTYPTRWGGPLTLEQIITDSVLRRAAFAKTASLGLDAEDQADCVQQGFIRLWQKLRDDPHLLADKGPVWVGLYVAYGGDPKQFHRHKMQQRTFCLSGAKALAMDDYAGLRRPARTNPPHAPWTQVIDETLDVERFLKTMTQYYADQPQKQIALQAVVGAISAKEAARHLGLHEKNFAASIGHQVRQEVQAHLPDSLKAAQPEAWQVKLARGEGVDHITQIAQEVMHHPRLLLALYVVTTSASKKVVAQTFGYGLTAFGKDIRKIKARIAEKFRRADLDFLSAGVSCEP